MSYNGDNRKIKADITRQKIYDSAVKLLAENDYKDVSVDAIVKLAGVAKGSFYVHFESKDALVTTLIQEQVKQVDADYKNFISSFADDESAATMLLALISKIADVLIHNIGCEKMKIIYQAQISKNVNAEVVSDYNRDIYDLFSSVLDRGMRSGEFNSDVPLVILTRHFMMAIRGITYEWCIRFPDFDYRMEALQHFKILLAGIKNN